MQPFTRRLFSSRVFVRNIPKNWTNDQVSSHFSKGAPVSDINLVKSASGENSGKAVLTYSSKQDADASIK